jgi:hypothetical protein
MRGKSSRKAEEFWRITALPTQWLCHSDARQTSGKTTRWISGYPPNGFAAPMRGKQAEKLRVGSADTHPMALPL